jgi:hypothetical protein
VFGGGGARVEVEGAAEWREARGDDGLPLLSAQPAQFFRGSFFLFLFLLSFLLFSVAQRTNGSLGGVGSCVLVIFFAGFLRQDSILYTRGLAGDDSDTDTSTFLRIFTFSSFRIKFSGKHRIATAGVLASDGGTELLRCSVLVDGTV